MISSDALLTARTRVSSALSPTPILFSQMLSTQLGAQVYLKLDNFQRTGSFKERGALNCLLSLSQDERKTGVVTASAGNHAQAVAYHATQLGIASTIFMPTTTPLVKITRTQAFGGKIQLSGDNYDEAHEAAEEYARKIGAFYIHAYDNPCVIAGQASAGFEVLEQLPELDVLLVPVGGGGLLSGIALAVEQMKRKIHLVGVQTEAVPGMIQALKHGSPIQLPAASTLADGIRVRKVGELTFPICQRLVNEWISLTDNEIALAVLHLMEQEKIVAEGAGAISVAALLSGKMGSLKGKKVCAFIGGGNIDLTLLTRILERGMAETGRLVKLFLSIHDRPGELARLLQMIGKCEANVLEVHHERAFAESAWNDVDVDLVLETKGKSHIEEILEQMKAKGYRVAKVDSEGAKGWLTPNPR